MPDSKNKCANRLLQSIFPIAALKIYFCHTICILELLRGCQLRLSVVLSFQVTSDTLKNINYSLISEKKNWSITDARTI